MLSVLSLMGANIDMPEDHCRRSPTGHEPSVQDHEDDEDLQDHDNVGMTKAEIRKSNKPIMEKRRRARINTCLNELKSLILDALKKDPSRHSKLEKADILEMTVKHLQAVQRQQLALAVAHDPSVLEKFKNGFTECAQEITRYISRIDGVDTGVRQRLMQHLSHCTSSLNASTPLSFTAMAGVPIAFGNSHNMSFPPPNGDLNNNQARLLHRLVAARLAAAGDTTGAALLLQGGLSLLARGSTTAPPPPPPHPPPSAHPPGHIQTLQPPVHSNNQPKVNSRVVNDGASSSRLSNPRISAFTAVRRCTSPPRIVANPPRANALPKIPKIITPRAIRPVPPPEAPTKTLVQAQVALKPVSESLSSSGDEVTCPLDFSFRRTCEKRPMEGPVAYPRPAKVLKVTENASPTPSLPVVQNPRETGAREPAPPPKELSPGSVSDPPEGKDRVDNPEGDEKDMWRPW